MDGTGKREKTNAMSAVWYSRRTGVGRAWTRRSNEGVLALSQVSTGEIRMVETEGVGFGGMGRGGEQGREIREADVLLCDPHVFVVLVQ
ncbi:hypothetical protein AG1IA_07465 [Rhizoctonia solani AG-1 IA]|uniref:Uncharacterized protein n=1 Tax=Thanatephorus cucumeris (strain AG1-IA) TaxID=983506 RepID=L8WQ84_THACA|nr:hypothetical protein AG1IA_07465 [Rhizoctonia solani AG-1 IA]